MTETRKDDLQRVLLTELQAGLYRNQADLRSIQEKTDQVMRRNLEMQVLADKLRRMQER